MCAVQPVEATSARRNRAKLIRMGHHASNAALLQRPGSSQT
ncbi:hypothetical protein K788_0006358 [Paraburkholderia caribensis MBA4]|uniref:Uncharacterized protein n=1 Tax=Paraburkholderia caribensis MBA4 TaxID=1323664 RepID=A0A0P0RG77_9BURK|nr:hypothetical protein K788_0006358 [Paraburkholderia caribensis MBA4]